MKNIWLYSYLNIQDKNVPEHKVLNVKYLGLVGLEYFQLNDEKLLLIFSYSEIVKPSLQNLDDNQQK